MGLERGFSKTLGDGEDRLGEGKVHKLRLCGDRVDNAAECGLELCLRGCGNKTYERDFGGEEWVCAWLVKDLSEIDCWLRSESCKVGIGRGDSQGEGMSEAETCWSSVSCMPARSVDSIV